MEIKKIIQKKKYNVINFQDIDFMKRKIIGYKLIKAAIEISDIDSYPTERGYYCIEGNSRSISNFKKAGILDICFEPVYKEIIEFKVGDWVVPLVAGYGCGENHIDKAYKVTNVYILEYRNGDAIINVEFGFGRHPVLVDGKYVVRHATEEEIIEFKVGDWVRDCNGYVARITKIDDIYFYTTKKYHKYANFNGSDTGWIRISYTSYRHATEDEILKALKDEFVTRTGIDVGSKIIDNVGYSSIVNDFFLITRENYQKSSHSVEKDYESKEEQYLLGIKYNNGNLHVPAECVRLLKFTFAGHSVSFEKVSSGVRITCNGETGTLSQIEQIVEAFTPKRLFFGSQSVQEIHYDNTIDTGDKFFEAIQTVKIGCLTDTWDELLAIYEHAKTL